MGHKGLRGPYLLASLLAQTENWVCTGQACFVPHVPCPAQAPYPGSPWNPLHPRSALWRTPTTLPLKRPKPSSSPPLPLHLQWPVRSARCFSLGPLQLFLFTEQSAAWNLFVRSPGSALSFAVASTVEPFSEPHPCRSISCLAPR